MYYIHLKFLILGSLELKARVNFSDSLLSVVCLSVCLSVCKLFKCSWPTGPTWGKLSTKHTWREGIHEGSRPFPRELCSSLFIARKCFSCMQCGQWTSLSYSIKVKLLYCWNQVYSHKKRKFQFFKPKHFILFGKYGMTNYCSNICMYDSNW